MEMKSDSDDTMLGLHTMHRIRRWPRAVPGAEGTRLPGLYGAAGQETSVNVGRDWPPLILFTRLWRDLPRLAGSEGRRVLSQAVPAWAVTRPVNTRGLQGNPEAVSACLARMALCVTLGLPKASGWITVIYPWLRQTRECLV